MIREWGEGDVGPLSPESAPSAPLELEAFLRPFYFLLRRSENRRALERYVTGLLSDLPRKTASDMGRGLAGTNGQRLQEFLTRTTWDPVAMDRLRARHLVAHASLGDGVLVLGEIVFPKAGTESVGVARQYTRSLGRRANCQVVIVAHYVDRVFDWPVGARLFLPETWTADAARRDRAKVPAAVQFETKGEIALTLLDDVRTVGVPATTVVAAGEFAADPAFFEGLRARGVSFIVEVDAAAPFRQQGPGWPGVADGVTDVRAIVDAVPGEAWRRVAWREGPGAPRVKEFAFVRAMAGWAEAADGAGGWIVGERAVPGHPGGRAHYFASAAGGRGLVPEAGGSGKVPVPEAVARFGPTSPPRRARLVALAHLPRMIERFDREARAVLGLDHYEGRFWTGFHRHLALVMLAHAFLTLRTAYCEGPSPGARRRPRPAPFPPVAAEEPPGAVAEGA